MSMNLLTKLGSCTLKVVICPPKSLIVGKNTHKTIKKQVIYGKNHH